jgi:hypothetical protein
MDDYLSPAKACRGCGALKTLTDFNRQARAPDGRQYMCKTCVAGVRQGVTLPGAESARRTAFAQAFRRGAGQSGQTIAGNDATKPSTLGAGAPSCTAANASKVSR